MKTKIDPKYDGITHINVYSKGATWLGRMLTNFAKTPFEHPIHGSFQSVEGYWYWLTRQDDSLRLVSGFQAKKKGRELKKVKEYTDGEFKAFIKQAIEVKLDQNRDISQVLRYNKLPLSHYYYYGDIENPKVYDLPQYKWITDIIENYEKDEDEL